jgi:predicted MPP superfamily phosphohydrolase
VRLPGYGALVALSAFNKRYEAGLYRVKDTWLYVNRGIGLQGDAAPRVRFLCRPEITILDLVPEELVIPSAAGRTP